MTSGTVKRLRVRLKAQTEVELGEAFGPFLSGDGVFLIGDPSLPDYTRVYFQLLFADGQVALEGKGQVLGRRGEDPGPAGLIIGLDWSSGSRARLDRLLGHDPKSDPVPVPVPVPIQGPSQDLIDEHSSFDDEPLDEPAPAPSTPMDSADEPVMSQDLIDASGGFDDEPLDEDLELTELPNVAPAAPDLISDLVSAMPLPGTPPPLSAKPVLTESEGAAERFNFGDDVRARLRGAPSTEYAYSSEDVWSDDVSGEYDRSGADSLREPGEVTPLARLELVRKYTAPTLQTGDLEPLSSGPPSSAIPSKKLRPELDKKTGRAFAVDLGHSVTRIAGPTLMGPATLRFRSGADAIPSAVLIEPEGRTWVGEHAASRVLRNHRHTIYGTRRLIGRPFASPLIAALDHGLTAPLTSAEESETAVRIGDYTVSFEETAALILKEAKESASVAMAEPVNRVVLTAPASYGQRQRAGLSVAGLLAGLHVEAVVSVWHKDQAAFAAGKVEFPFWIVLVCHAAIALGTMCGGWRIVKTMGMRITKLRPYDGACAELAAATSLFTSAAMGVPVSTTHTITGAIVGVGAVQRLSAVRWGVARQVVWAWILTIPCSAIVAAVAYWIIALFR